MIPYEIRTEEIWSVCMKLLFFISVLNYAE